MELATHPLIERLGWTLLHSLWQGALIALVYAALAALLRGRRPEVRYGLSLSAFALLALLPVATFVWLGGGPEAAPTVHGGARHARDMVVMFGAPSNDFDLLVLLQPALPWIVALWCTGVLASALKVWDAWRQLVALRRSAVTLGGLELARIVERLRIELGIARGVRIARSALVASPTVIGWLEPLILVPTAALVGLTPDQLAMILTHELAHIRRHDYIVNALQTVVETLLFYHPAVHWISERVRHEREECCDAVAVRMSGDPFGYARALAELEELRGLATSLALAATGGELLERIERLLGQRPHRQRGAALASACALATLTALAATVGAPLVASDPVVTTVQHAAVAQPLAHESMATVLGTIRTVPQEASDAPAPRQPVIAPPAPRPVDRGALASRPAPLLQPAMATGPIELPSPEPAAPDEAAGTTAAVPDDATLSDQPATGAGPALTGGELLVGVAPSYPYYAERRALSGVVTAHLEVDATGRTRAVTIVSADPPGVFENAVLRAAGNWRFAPFRADGMPVEHDFEQRFYFNIANPPCEPITGSRLCRSLDPFRGRPADAVQVIRLQ